MFIGVPKEIKTDEYRVSLTPETVKALSARGNRVAVETMAGAGAGITDDEYVAAGAEIIADADQIFQRAELIVKVKEPLASERKRLRRGQIIFTYLHLAPDAEQSHDLMASGVTALAYETVTDAAGKLPLLAPMSRVAGSMAPQVAAHFLQRPQGGRGVLLGRIEGLPAAEVVILGGGVVGSNSAEMATGMGANVSVAVHSPETMRHLSQLFGKRARLVTADAGAVEDLCTAADVVIGAALVAGGAAPKLISRRTVAAMKPGSVIVDVSIDQGGCFEDSRPTTHADPTYTVHNSVFYCVANMPGAVPHTSTYALTNVTLPYAVELANRGWRDALRADHALALGLNTHDGHVTYGPVAEAHGFASVELAEVLG